ncbi:MAG TPA: PEP-CTERM sorting domain-containing protein [Isosphaeraceae bacterium]|jgi:hypothetical protein|nr:PEP-CTERM sorting domain-containing protein [Isosphaeraceae bacterium]
MISFRPLSRIAAALAVIVLAAPHAQAGIFAQAAPALPEPSSVILLGIGALGAAGYAMYHRKKGR